MMKCVTFIAALEIIERAEHHLNEKRDVTTNDYTGVTFK